MQLHHERDLRPKKLTIAFRIWLNRLHEAEFKAHRRHRLWESGVKDSEGNVIMIPRHRLKDYMTDEFWTALFIWNRTENLGCLPFAGGWAEQPGFISEVLNLFKVEQAAWDKAQWEKDRNKK